MTEGGGERYLAILRHHDDLVRWAFPPGHEHERAAAPSPALADAVQRAYAGSLVIDEGR